MDIANYADMGGNVRRVTHDTNHSVWRAEGTDGQGIMTMHDVMPGITLMFNDFTSVWNLESGFKLTPGSRMLCLNYCREGRIEWESGTDSCLYLDVGDLGIDDHARHESLFRFPFGHYRGVTVCLDPDIADKSLQSMFPEGFPVSVKQLYERFCSGDEPSVLRSGPSVEHIFCEIYNAHDRFRDAYLKLKIMELLLFLGSNIPEGGHIGQYGLTRAQVDKVKEIERAITSDLSSHKTLKELSQEFEFPYASMQRWFKEVYGTSVHVYLTRYRMAQAATLLRTTSKPIGEVAFEVGYTNASKFASTFRNVVGMAPGDYRESAGQER